MLRKSLLSIITPVLNGARFLDAAVASVDRQTFQDWEHLVVIDPKTTDDSYAIAAKSCERETRRRVLKGNHPGVAHSRNQALKEAKGEWIAFLDADDEWLPEKTAVQLAAMQDAGEVWSCTGYRRLSQDGSRIGRLITPPVSINYRRLLQENCILCSSVIVHRSCVEAFREIGCEDYDLWLRLLAKGRTAQGQAQDGVRYRIVQNSRSAKHRRIWLESWQLWRQQQRLPLWQSLALASVFSARNAMKYARF